MNKQNVLSALFFKFMERCGVQGVQFVIGIILARILSPDEYGLLAIVTVFTTLASSFIQQGIGTALVQSKETTDDDCSTVFHINLGLSIILYLLLFFTAPLIGKVYGNDSISQMIRWLSVTLFFGSYTSIVNAKLTKKLRFKLIMKRSIVSVSISGVVGIGLALSGAGIWALVVQNICHHICDSIVLYLSVRWLPKMIFQKERAKRLFDFGWKISVASILDTLYKELRSVLIGKKYAPEILGYYNRARQFPQLLITNINGAIQSVMLPVLSNYQEDKKQLKAVMRRSITTSTFIVFPMLAGLAAVAPSLVKLLLTDKWMPCVPMMQLLCLNMAFYPIHTANLQAIKAVGRSDIFLKLDIFKKIIGASILLTAFFAFESIYAIVIGGIIGTVLESIINAYPNKKLLDYSYLEQIKDIFASICLSLLMFVIVLMLGEIKASLIVILLIQITAGIVVYTFMAKIMHVEIFEYLCTTFGKVLKGRKNRNDEGQVQ